MVRGIIERFEETFKIYDKLVEVTENVFKCVKTKSIKELESLNKLEVQYILELKKACENLKKEIGRVCETMGVQNHKLSALDSFLSIKEKEEIKACQRTALNYEEKLKNNRKMNICLVETMMNCSQTLIDAWIYVVNQEKGGKGVNAFINKKL